MAANSIKGIILAGGSGTRLYPVTRAISKQLVPVHDKPMIYYPLSTLMLAGIREILIITTPEDQASFKDCSATAPNWGSSSHTPHSPSPEGPRPGVHLSSAKFVGADRVALVLGDNIFYGHGLPECLRSAAASAADGATVFAYQVRDPQRYGVVEFDAQGPRVEPGRKARGAKVELRRDRPVLLRQRRARHCRQAQALAARRIGDHRRQQGSISSAARSTSSA